MICSRWMIFSLRSAPSRRWSARSPSPSSPRRRWRTPPAPPCGSCAAKSARPRTPSAPNWTTSSRTPPPTIFAGRGGFAAQRPLCGARPRRVPGRGGRRHPRCLLHRRHHLCGAHRRGGGQCPHHAAARPGAGGDHPDSHGPSPPRWRSWNPQFSHSYEAMLQIDLLLAKARLAVEENAFLPTVNDGVHFKLNKPAIR